MRFPSVERDSSGELVPKQIEIANVNPNGRIFVPEGEAITKYLNWMPPVAPTSDKYLPNIYLDASPTSILKPRLIPNVELFNRERDAFLRMKDSLCSHEKYKGKFVAIHSGNVVDVDENKKELAKRVYAKYGYIPIYIDKVEKKRIVGEMSSPERV